MTGLPIFCDIRQGHLTPPCRYSSQGSVHHIEAKRIEGITRGTRLPRCFPVDLPGMPPEGDIKFKIELQPGTTSVAKSLYRMT
jgi:hypothetical protein